MLELMAKLSTVAKAALQGEFGDHPALVSDLSIGRATKREFGDVQISAAMALGKKLGRPPRDLAALMLKSVAADELVARAEVAGPGFVNVWFKDQVIVDAATSLELRPIGRGQTVVIDYSSPNVAKPMHIGHIRSTIIGEALKRVLRALSYQVIADNHLGDWGTQFGKLIVAYKRWLDTDAFAKAPVEELLRIYIKYTQEEKREAGEEIAEDEATKSAPPILQEARRELVKLQAGDAKNVALWKTFIEVSMAEFARIYARLDVSFDVTLGESFYNDRLAATVALLQEKGIAVESEGAIAVFFSKERDGEELPPFLVRKGDGGFNYGTSDVAAVLYRVEHWSAGRILIVVDERQQLHFKQLFATARRLGVTASLEHVWFGLMRLPEGVIRTRDGEGLIYLDDFLDEAERRAEKVATEHNPALSETERREVARVVGLGAVRYNDLSKDRRTMITFTWDKALSLTGNTAPYLQYAYARMRSILRKASAEDYAPGPIAREVLSPVERDLLTRLLWYPDAVEQVARTACPHILCDYLFDLASAMSTFYAEHPVLKAEPEIRSSRLTLIDRVAQVLSDGLGLLGIGVLERM